MFVENRTTTFKDLFIYLGFYVAFNTVQVISPRVVGRAEETSTYSLLGFCTLNSRPTASNYQLSHLRPCRESNPSLRGGRRECYHSATVAPTTFKEKVRLHCTSFLNRFVKIRNKFISNYYFSHIMKYFKVIANWNNRLFIT